MTKRRITDLILGPAAERPAANNPHAGVSDIAEHPTYLAIDTGDISESTGSAWSSIGTLAGGGGDTDPEATTSTLGTVLVDHAKSGAHSTALTTDGVAVPAAMLGTGSTQAAAGNDSRLSDARTPTTHATSHETGGSDVLTLDAAQINGLPASALTTTAVDYAALLTESWIVVTAANKIVTLPDAATVPANHPGFTVKVFGGSNCTVEPTQLAPPATPVPTSPHTGGTVADGVYTVKVTYVNALGETLGSASATVTAAGTVADTSTLVIPSPIAETGATGWNAYVSAADGVTLYLQNVSPTAIATDLTLTAPPSSITAQPPTSSTASVCAIDGVATYTGLVADKSAATFKSNGIDYLVD